MQDAKYTVPVISLKENKQQPARTAETQTATQQAETRRKLFMSYYHYALTSAKSYH